MINSRIKININIQNEKLNSMYFDSIASPPRKSNRTENRGKREKRLAAGVNCSFYDMNAGNLPVSI